jgi:hypothetical protein
MDPKEIGILLKSIDTDIEMCNKAISGWEEVLDKSTNGFVKTYTRSQLSKDGGKLASLKDKKARYIKVLLDVDTD